MVTKSKYQDGALLLGVDDVKEFLTIGPAVIYVSEASGAFAAKFISPNVKSQMGYQPDDFIEDPNFWASHIHPEDKPRVFDELQSLFEHDKHTHEYRFRTKDGGYRWMRDELKLIRDSGGNPMKIIGCWTDIDERKRGEDALHRAHEELERQVRERTADLKQANLALRAEVKKHEQTGASLRESEARFRGIVNYSPAAVTLKDTDGRFLLVNRKFEEWYGVTAVDCQGKTTYDLVPVEYAHGLVAADREVLDRGRVVEREEDMPLADGTIHRVVVTKFPVIDDAGRTIGIGTISVDVTRQRAAEAQLHQARKMEAVGQLTGGVAHDFNNLLTVILGNAELIEQRAGEDERLRRRISAVRAAARRGANLTHKLLAFSSKQQLAPEVTILGELVANWEKLLRQTLGASVDLRMEISRDLWPVKVDTTQLESALLNLSINARDAMPSGGTFTIEAANTTLDQSDVGYDPHMAAGDYVRLSVSDTGTGIAEETLGHIFEPFYTTKEAGIGAGLGLSMVHGFVNQSGGYVKVNSVLGRGTTIEINLPRAEAGARTDRDEPAATGNKPGGGETILVVEDEPQVREIAVAILEKLGYRVLEAENALAALAVLDRTPEIDLLFTDVVMPGGMSGLQLAAKVKSRLPEIKIVATSGYTGAVEQESDMHEIADQWISKPYDDRELARKVRIELDRPRSVDS